ncbi:MAG: phosphopantothenoylcysteine decarboxylase [Endomicrobiales bacterium]|nr:phosphopantothenoylcysteine decarboxylase [Endomicrobiales bacterium]
MANLKNKNVIVGVCGGIAAYKACELVRILVKSGASVTCLLTENGAKFITPLTLRTLSKNKVYCDMFEDAEWDIEHVSLADKADAVIIAPATADVMARLASGRAEDLLSSVVLASRAPVVICPSMNENMWKHPATRKNEKTLAGYGYVIVEPDKGELACGKTGEGRLAKPERIAQKVSEVLSAK